MKQLKGKVAFELFTASKEIKIKTYHADYGVLCKLLSLACHESKSKFYFEEVNVHDQNEIAE